MTDNNEAWHKYKFGYSKKFSDNWSRIFGNDKHKDSDTRLGEKKQHDAAKAWNESSGNESGGEVPSRQQKARAKA
ncbi:MAG: hypothetical protein HN975_07615 [Anaerolineae bacterium]|jgi:hypothetical protein|nr:hypothetical protein [Anaerolineae bacterium]